jgi:hypothetical protein
VRLCRRILSIFRAFEIASTQDVAILIMNVRYLWDTAAGRIVDSERRAFSPWSIRRRKPRPSSPFSIDGAVESQETNGARVEFVDGGITASAPDSIAQGRPRKATGGLLRSR